MQLLREIMHVYSSSLLGDESEEDERAGFSSVLDTMVNAAIEMLANLSDVKQRQKPAWDARVFMLNCLTSMIVSWLTRGGETMSDIAIIALS
jgi:hypothetical protein